LVRLENFIDEAALKKLPNAFENIVEWEREREEWGVDCRKASRNLENTKKTKRKEYVTITFGHNSE
jgi:hypothetical protein